MQKKKKKKLRKNETYRFENGEYGIRREAPLKTLSDCTGTLLCTHIHRSAKRKLKAKTKAETAFLTEQKPEDEERESKSSIAMVEKEKEKEKERECVWDLKLQ